MRAQYCYLCAEAITVKPGLPDECPGCGPQWLTYRPSVCADAALLDREGRILLIERKNEPGAGEWSMPGGHVEPLELPVDASLRELIEETGLDAFVSPLGQVGTYIDDVPNDPRLVIVYAWAMYSYDWVPTLDESEASNVTWSKISLARTPWKRRAFADAQSLFRSDNA